MNILIIPKQCDSLMSIMLPEPKEGKLRQYYYDENNLAIYETVKFNDQYRSWFLDDKFCKDGHFNMLTKVDPLFIFILVLEKFASKQFRTLADICSSFAETASDNNSVKIDYALSPNINWDNVCETKELDDELYLRYSEIKTLMWLENKFCRALQFLKEKSIVGDAFELIEYYLTPSMSTKFREYLKNNPKK